MHTTTIVGLDIAKSVFQVHGIDADGNVVVRRQLKRRYVLSFFQKLPPCLVGIEACASSHYWSRELQALGHTVRLMPPAYVRPYVKRHKNDAADAEAICEAVTRPNMRCADQDPRAELLDTPPHTTSVHSPTDGWLWSARGLLLDHSAWTPQSRRYKSLTDLLPSGEQSRFSALRHRNDYAASWIRRFPLDASPRLLSQQRHEP